MMDYSQAQINTLIKALNDQKSAQAAQPDQSNQGLLSIIKKLLGIKDDKKDSVAQGLIGQNQKRSALLNLGGQPTGLLGMGGQNVGLLSKLTSMF